jgi:hypothetical protein
MLRLTTRRGALAVVLALIPGTAFLPATAVASATSADTWTGQSSDFLQVQIIRRDNSRAKATAVVTYVCSVNGQYSTLQAELEGRIHHNKIKLHGPTEDQTGKAHVRATLTKPKAKVSATVTDSQGSCEVNGDFKAKFKRYTGS